MNTRTVCVLTFLLLALLGTATANAEEPTAAPSTFPVRWEMAPLPTFNGVELAYPWAHRTPETKEPVWQVYEASPHGTPRLLYETQRALSQPVWDNHAASIRVRAASLGVPTISRENREERGLIGFTRIGLDGAVKDDLLFYPTAPVLSGDGRSVAFIDRGGAIYIRQPGTPDRKFEVPGRYLQLVSWAPDGSALLLSLFDASNPRDASPVYLVPVVDGEARYVFTTNFSPVAAWSHHGSRMAYIEDGDLFIYDRATNKSERLADADYDIVSGTISVMEWSKDDSILVVGADLLDARTARRIVRLVPPNAGNTHYLSKDNRYFIASDHAYGFTSPDGPCARPPSQNHTYLYDLTTGTTTTLRDCDGVFRLSGPGMLTANDGRRRAAMYLFDCELCDYSAFRVRVIALDDGSEVELGPGRVEISPDATRMLIGGTALKLYSADLTVLRDIPLPEGIRVYGIAWSPDGSRFVYVVGPVGLS